MKLPCGALLSVNSWSCASAPEKLTRPLQTSRESGPSSSLWSFLQILIANHLLLSKALPFLWSALPFAKLVLEDDT